MTHSWNATKFDNAPLEIIDGDRGTNYPKHTEFYDDGFCLFLNAGNVSRSGFSFTSVQFIDQTKDGKLRKGKLRRHDVVMTTRGTIGNVAHYTKDVPFEHVRINSGMVILRCDVKRLLPQFLYHFLRTPNFYSQVNSLRSGVAQPQLPIRDIKRIELPLPSIEDQWRIAQNISAYDELIENNQRRMVLLEEAARLLYQEWFVHLRFPGYEHARITNGLPDDWKRKPLSELCESIDYGYTTSAEHEDVGPKFLRITDIVPELIDWAAVPHCSIEDEKLERFRLLEGDIVIARTGATVGYAKRLHKRHPATVFASYLVRLRLKPDTDNMMVGVFVESNAYKSYVQSRVGGAAQPNANAKVLAGAEILVPPPRVQLDFREFAEPIIDQREVLQFQNQKLRAARDFLLPRLMSGEITV